MTSVITGDIIKSRTILDTDSWLIPLKSALSKLASNSNSYEIYRGDSFQIEIKDTYTSFIVAIYIKACIKTIKSLDVRLAIGIGDKSYTGKTISESNGEAFVFSGEALETLKKEKQNLKLKTKNAILNREINLFFKFALISMDSWTINSAEIVKLSIEHPDKIQQELAKGIGISQDAVSKRQKRAHLDKILELDLFYREKIATLL